MEEYFAGIERPRAFEVCEHRIEREKSVLRERFCGKEPSEKREQCAAKGRADARC